MKYKKNPRLHNQQAPWLFNALTALGIDEEALFRNTSLQRSQDQQTLLLPSIDAYYEALEYGDSVSDSPAFGIELAHQIQFSDLGILGYLLENSSDLASFLEVMIKYHNLLGQGFYHTLRIEKGMAVLDYKAPNPNREGYRIDIEFTLAVIALYFHKSFAEQWSPAACHFTYKEPEELDLYHNIFGSQLVFGYPANQIIFSLQNLTEKLEGKDQALFSLLESQAKEQITRLEPVHDLEESIERILNDYLGQGVISKKLALEALNLSERSLNRQLQMKGTTFNQIRNRVLIKAAKQALLEGDEPISQIALWLGFSESSAFIRHFKRETGSTPNQYKKSKLS